jgi:hypothetical protein
LPERLGTFLQHAGYLDDVAAGIARQARARGIASLTNPQFQAAELAMRRFGQEHKCVVCAKGIEAADLSAFLRSDTCTSHEPV